MLPMQVQYWTYQETKRHNFVTERQTDQYNQEIQRHNMAYEQETHRHNVEGEQLGWASLAETTRHNKASEGIGWATVAETSRHNMVYEAEMNRHNVAQENVSALQAFSSIWNSKVNQQNANTSRKRAKYQNAYDAARTASAYADTDYTRKRIELVPYEKWKSVAGTVESFTKAGKNVADGWNTTVKTFQDVANVFSSLRYNGQTSLFGYRK